MKKRVDLILRLLNVESPLLVERIRNDRSRSEALMSEYAQLKPKYEAEKQRVENQKMVSSFLASGFDSDSKQIHWQNRL